jgi:hypothetical protein
MTLGLGFRQRRAWRREDGSRDPGIGHRRRTARLVLFTGEEQGMIGATAYVARHRAEMDQTVAALMMDVGRASARLVLDGANRSDEEIRELMKPVASFGYRQSTFSLAATDNASMAGHPEPDICRTSRCMLLITVADTATRQMRDFGTCVATRGPHHRRPVCRFGED